MAFVLTFKLLKAEKKFFYLIKGKKNIFVNKTNK